MDQFEELAAKIDAEEVERKVEEAEAVADVQEVAADDETPEVNFEEETNVKLIGERIQRIVYVLQSFRTRRDAEHSRSEYVDLLKRDLCIYYGYCEYLIDLFLDLFSPDEALEFLEASEKPRPLTLRVNSLRSRRRELAHALITRGVNLDPLDWSKVGLQVYDSTVSLGATPEYLAGQYMIQAAASFLPCVALDPKPHEKVLDMCAAPGGKTTYLSQMMKNTGVVIANDVNDKRIPALVANIHRMGATNTVVCCKDGRQLRDMTRGFDRVLLDAPCTGLGVISRDQSVKFDKSDKDVQKCAHIQRELLLTAIDLVDASRPEATIVYSTCSITVEENEAVVDYALAHRDVKIVETGIPFGRPGLTRHRTKRFHPAVAKSVRVYPHTHNMDGFYVCKMIKVSNKGSEAPKALPKELKSARATAQSAQAKARNEREAKKTMASKPQPKPEPKQEAKPEVEAEKTAEPESKPEEKVEPTPAPAPTRCLLVAPSRLAPAPEPTPVIEDVEETPEPVKEKAQKKKPRGDWRGGKRRPAPKGHGKRPRRN